MKLLNYLKKAWMHCPIANCIQWLLGNSNRVKFPKTDSDWHCPHHRRESFSKPTQLLISINFPQASLEERWEDLVYHVLDGINDNLANEERLPYDLVDSQSGETVGKLVIVSEKLKKISLKKLSALVDKELVGK